LGVVVGGCIEVGVVVFDGALVEVIFVI